MEQQAVGFAFRYNQEFFSGTTKKLNFIAHLALATPQKVYIIRTHRDTRLADYIFSLLRDKKVVKATLQNQKTVNQRMQRTFGQTPANLQEGLLFSDFILE